MEEALDLSSDRILNDDDDIYIYIYIYMYVYVSVHWLVVTKNIYTCHLFMVSNMPVNSTLLLQVASTHTLWDNNVLSTANFT